MTAENQWKVRNRPKRPRSEVVAIATAPQKARNLMLSSPLFAELPSFESSSFAKVTPCCTSSLLRKSVAADSGVDSVDMLVMKVCRQQGAAFDKGGERQALRIGPGRKLKVLDRGASSVENEEANSNADIPNPKP